MVLKELRTAPAICKLARAESRYVPTQYVYIHIGSNKIHPALVRAPFRFVFYFPLLSKSGQTLGIEGESKVPSSK